MIKGFKVRLYPDKEQINKIWDNVNASRFIWNYMLNVENQHYEEVRNLSDEDKKETKKFLSSFDLSGLLPDLKKDENYKWLKAADSVNLTATCRDLENAFKKFFKKQGNYPKFKSKKTAKASYPTNPDGVNFYEDYISLPKVGRVKYKTDKEFPLGYKVCKFSNTRVTVTAKGKVILSFGMECEEEKTETTDRKMGIDLGVKDLAIIAYGDEHIVIPSINKTKRVKDLERKLKHLQRNVSRKYHYLHKQLGTWDKVREHIKENGKSNSLIKAEKKVKLLNEYLANIRNNYTHHATHNVIVNLRPKQLKMEDLNISGMMKNKHLSKAIAKQTLHEFRRQIEYKAKLYGVDVEFVDRFYPSSKTCHNCGYIHKELKLKDRTFICPVCGYTEDRDVNAAMNLRDWVGILGDLSPG